MRSGTGARVMLLLVAGMFFTAGLLGALGLFLDAQATREGPARDLSFLLAGTVFIGSAIVLVGYFLLMELQGQGAPIPTPVESHRPRSTRRKRQSDDFDGLPRRPGHDLRIGRYDSWS